MPSRKNKTEPPATKQNFPVVGIGASAGGLDAFKRFLGAIPEDSGMAYVLVQHLDPSHESVLPEILSRATKIPVHEITDDIKLAPDHIYIIPPNKILISTDGILKLAARDKKILNLSIDVFLKSLAEVHTSFAVGVVLSGTGSDGTLGLKAVKEYGGITFAQDKESAAYDSMPQSAVDAGVVDFILSPEKIPAKLLQIRSTYKTAHAQSEDTGDDNDPPISKDDEDIYKQIISLLRLRSGVDFTHYKQPTIRRRIARRMAVGEKKSLGQYLKLLRSDKAEQDALFQDMLIPVTSFLRDPKTFETVCDTVFPALFKDKPHDESLRIWIAGCSTGEEAYSLAICLHEFLGKKSSNAKIQIFASDISEAAIKIARAGIYSKVDVQKFSQAQLENYFTKNNGGYEVSKEIRNMCVFAPHDFLKDPPFAKMDLISCRNVLIYMGTFLQKKALTTFHYALKEKGFLLLGKSETIDSSSDLFTQISKRNKIYSRNLVPGRFIHVATERKEESLATKDKKSRKQEPVRTDFRKSAEEILLSKFTPASVIVNEQLDIVHIHGVITPFLEAPQGKPTYSLLKMAREGLAFELRNALHKVKTSGASVRKENIPVKINGKQSLVSINIVALTDTVEAHYLILFTKIAVADADEKGKTSLSAKTKGNEIQLRNERLEKELAQAREDMRGITEDMDAANEELQSANEELQSSNEEMQSLNEELETSKEELQSTNEELIIVNQELTDKQEQLSAARNYSEAIVSTLREPLIVLDRWLCIKTANASFYKKFNLEEQETENKYFYEIQGRQFNDLMLRSLLEKILPQKSSVVDFEIILQFPSLGERHLLINARQIVNEKTAEQLILLAIEDVTERKISDQKLTIVLDELKEKNNLIEASEKRYSNLLSQSFMAIGILKGEEMTISFANEALLKIWGKGKDVVGKRLLDVLPEIKGEPFQKLLSDVYTSGVPCEENELKTVFMNNGKPEEYYFSVVFQPYIEVDDTIIGVTVLAIDTTEYVRIKKEIEVNEKRFRMLSETIPHMVWTASPEGNKNFFNKYYLDYTGLSFEELTGDGMVNIIFPDDVEKDLQQWRHSLQTGEDFNIEKRLRRFDGTYRWHVSHGTAQKDIDGNITGWIGTSTEIEEQKKITDALAKGEEQFRTFANNIRNLAWIANADGEIYWYNQQWYDYTGTTFKEMEGLGWEKVHHPDHVKKVAEFVNEAWKKDKAFELTFPLRRYDGEYHWFLTRAYPIKDAAGNIERWVGTNTDITEQKSFAEELEKNVKERTSELQISIKELLKSNLQLDQFAHIASHDLQEPLRKITTFSKHLQEKHKEGLEPEIKKYINKIEEASIRMSTLIQDLLNYSRLLKSEKLFVQTDLNKTLKDILNDYELLIHEKGTTIRYDELSVLIAIPLQMNQLFYNLIGNALKFSKEGVPPQITITSRKLKEKDLTQHPDLDPHVAYCEIVFKDNGIGFEQKYSDRIFTIFQRLHSKDTFLGNGIGLALCKKIIENHHGKIFADGEDNNGAAFHVILPLVQPNL